MSDGILTNSVSERKRLRLPRSGRDPGDQCRDARRLGRVSAGARRRHEHGHQAGTNQWRGDGLYYWAPSALTSAPIKLPCNCPLGRVRVQAVQVRRTSAAMPAGPSSKDRLWYFGGVSNAGPSARFPGAPDTPEEYRWTPRRIPFEPQVHVRRSIRRMNFSQVFYYEWWHWSIPDFPTPESPRDAHLVHRRHSSRRVRTDGHPHPFDAPDGALHPVLHAVWGCRVRARRSTKNDLTDTGSRGSRSRVPRRTTPSRTRYQPRRDDVAVKVNQYFSRHADRPQPSLRRSGGAEQGRTGRTCGQAACNTRTSTGRRSRPCSRRPARTPPRSVAQGALGRERDDVREADDRPGRALRPHDRQQSRPRRIVDPTRGESGRRLVPMRHLVPVDRRESCRARRPVHVDEGRRLALGLTLKLTEDGKTMLRATGGPLLSADLPERVHRHASRESPPARLPRSIRPPAATPTVVSVTDPRANIAIDPDMDAPVHGPVFDWRRSRADEGRGRERHLRPQGVEGTRSAGSMSAAPMGTQTVTAPDGQAITVFPLLNAASARRFLRTNGPGYFSRYNGLILGLTRRYAEPLDGVTSATAIRSPRGFSRPAPPGGIPNDLINLTGAWKATIGPTSSMRAARMRFRRWRAGIREPDAHDRAPVRGASSRSGCRRGSEMSSSRRRVRIAGRISSGCTCG